MELSDHLQWTRKSLLTSPLPLSQPRHWMVGGVRPKYLLMFRKKFFRGIYRHVCVGLHLIKACTTANYQNVKNPQECDLPSRVFMPSIIEIFKSLSECGRQPWYSGHQNTGCYWGSQWSWSSHIPLNSCGSPCSPKKRMIPGPEQPHISSSTFFKIQMHLSNICTYFPSLIKINTRYKSRWWREHTFFILSHTAS